MGLYFYKVQPGCLEKIDWAAARLEAGARGGGVLDPVDGKRAAAGFVEDTRGPVPGVNPSQSLARPFLFATDWSSGVPVTQFFVVNELKRGRVWQVSFP